MNAKPQRSLFLALSFYALSCSGLLFGQGAPGAPNIILVLADDLGFGDVSSLNPQNRLITPHIDRLTDNGIAFTNAHAGASVCTPSRYGLLTGRYAFRAPSGGRGASGFGTPEIEPGRLTVAHLLRKAGYTTACIGKWHLGQTWITKVGDNRVVFDPATGLSNIDYSKEVTNGPGNQGFDYSFIHSASLDMPPYLFLRNHQVIDQEIILTSDIYQNRLAGTTYHWDKKHTNDQDVYWDKGIWWRRGEMSKSFRIERCLEDIVEEGLSFIENHQATGSSKPFFLYLPITAPHTPWVPSEKFRGKSDLDPYGGFVLQVDDVVGRITALLDKMAISDNTLVIFTSDNGAYWPEEEVELQQYNANYGRRGQKGDIWEGGHRIPLIVSWPSQIKKAYKNHHLVSLLDIYATLAELVNQDPGAGNGEDSFSFLPVLLGKETKPGRNSMVHYSSNLTYGFQKDGWKFVDGLGSGGFTAPAKISPTAGGATGQLYHLAVDSLETRNLMVEKPGLAKELKKELDEIVKNGRSN